MRREKERIRLRIILGREWIWRVQLTEYDCDEAGALRDLEEQEEYEFEERARLKEVEENRIYLEKKAILDTFTPENCREKLNSMTDEQQYHLLEGIDYEYDFICRKVSQRVSEWLRQDEERKEDEFSTMGTEWWRHEKLLIKARSDALALEKQTR